MIDLGKLLIPLPTPFDEEFEVDYEKAAQLGRKVSSLSFTDSVVVTATSGEFTSMTFEEKVKLFKTVKRVIGEKPLIAGTGAAFTKEGINLTKAAEEVGVDVAMLAPPYYLKPSQEGIYRHFKVIAENTKLPVMIYNVGFAGVNIEPDTIARLSEIENIFAIKEIGPNPLQVAETIMKSSRGFKVYAGSAALAPCILAQGGIGVVCEPMIGDRVQKLVDFYLSGDIKGGLEVYFDLITYFKIYGSRTNPVPILKYAMSLAGFDAGRPRPPLTELNEQEKVAIKETLQKLHII